jgi:trk system potassium uptake protein
MHSRYIVIVGCGRLGGVLANNLSAAGHSLVVIDRREIAFDKLSAEFSGFRILGDAIEMEVLQQARIDRANILFATTTEDNVNLMVAQVAREVFNVSRVVARVYDPAREAMYREFGIDTISPTKLSASAFLQVLEPGVPGANNHANHHDRRG